MEKKLNLNANLIKKYHQDIVFNMQNIQQKIIGALSFQGDEYKEAF
jgi:hypothetical protein